MGCFNRTGFLSHLPITYKDEIVVFLLADTSRINTIYSIPCYTVSSGFTPIALPFFGEYDDYGSIDNVTDDYNSRYFQEKIGMPVEEVCRLLLERENRNASYLSIKKNLKDLSDPSNETYAKAEKIKKYKELKNIYQKILGITEKLEEEINSSDELTRWQTNELLNCTITFTMDLKFVYDRMIEINNRKYDSDEYLGWGETLSSYSLEDVFGHTKELMDFLATRHTNKHFNPFTFECFRDVTLTPEEIEKLMSAREEDLAKLKTLIAKIGEFVKKEPYYWFSYFTRFTGAYSNFLDYILYNNFTGDILELKENALAFVRFLEMMRTTCTVFTLSPSHHQDVDYNRLADFYQELANFMQAEKEKQGTNAEEEDEEEEEIE